MRKRLRLLRNVEREVVFAVRMQQRAGIGLTAALRMVMLHPAAGWFTRGTAAEVLARGDAPGTMTSLIDLFFAQTGKIELYEAALTLERLNDRAAIRWLVPALHDANADRRHAAARALGWIRGGGPRAAKALIAVLADRSQPQPVRERLRNRSRTGTILRGFRR